MAILIDSVIYIRYKSTPFYMQRFFLLLALSLCLFSCNKNSNQENPFSEKLTFELDTVWVDSGDDFIFLRDNLFLSELGCSQKSQYQIHRYGQGQCLRH